MWLAAIWEQALKRGNACSQMAVNLCKNKDCFITVY